MKYFKICRDSNDFIELSVRTYERETDKKYPFYQVQSEAVYFAYCPGCDNTIKIINLYNNKRVDKEQKVQRMHGRHFPHNVEGFEPYDQEKYNNCPFANPQRFSGTNKRGKGKEAQEIIDLIVNHADVLHSFMRSISGINISGNLFDKMLKKFKDSEGIYFRHVTKFNLPYAFLYMAHNQNINYQFLVDEEISKCIKEKSNYFFISNKQIKPKNNQASIYTYFTDHTVSIVDHEPLHRMTMVVKEELPQEKNLIIEKEIEFNNYLFYRTISKNRRLKKWLWNITISF